MSHDSAGNETLTLLLITHFTDVDYSPCFVIHFMNYLLYILFVLPCFVQLE